MYGGHSGVDIHKEKANAIIILARFLKVLEKDCVGFSIVSIEGGTAHNAIPRNAYGEIVTTEENINKIKDLGNNFLREIRQEYGAVEPKMVLEVLDSEVKKKPCKSLVLDLILSIHHGVLYHSSNSEGLVETSSNLAQISTLENEFIITTSQRSSSSSRLREISNKMEAVCSLAGASITLNNGYPSWSPDFKGEVLAKFTELYKKLFNKEPIIEVIHAGLECGVIGSKYPEIKMISVGPTIKNPHSPDERMLIPTVNRVYKLLREYVNF